MLKKYIVIVFLSVLWITMYAQDNDVFTQDIKEFTEVAMRIYYYRDYESGLKYLDEQLFSGMNYIDSVAFLSLKASCYWGQGHYSEAIEERQEAINIVNRKNQRIVFGNRDILIQASNQISTNSKSKEDIYKDIADIYMQTESDYLYRSCIYFQLSDTAKAIDDIKHAIEMSEEVNRLHNFLHAFYDYSLGNFEDSLVLLKSLESVSSQANFDIMVGVKLWLSIVYSALGKDVEAKAHFLEAWEAWRLERGDRSYSITRFVAPILDIVVPPERAMKVIRDYEILAEKGALD